MIRRTLALAALLLLAGSAAAQRKPGTVRVRLQTALGPIVLALDAAHAPLTTANFLRYVDGGKLAGTTFYRAARSRRDPKIGLVQGGINHNIRNSYQSVAHEPTSRTGLRHVDGTLSMARNAPGTAMGDFFIVVGNGSSYLDATAGSPGYAAFGRVESGMPLVRRILAGATHPGGWSYATLGQALKAPVRILSAKRLP